jgi:type IV secretory pathway VirD2 relaxase
MQRALSAPGQERSPRDFAIIDTAIAPEQTMIGRVIEKGLHDELRGSAYLVLDGVDGRAHYLRVGSIDGISEYRKARSLRWNERRAGDRTRP